MAIKYRVCVIRYKNNYGVKINREYSNYEIAKKAVDALANAGFVVAIYKHNTGNHIRNGYGMELHKTALKDRKGIEANNGYGSAEPYNVNTNAIYEAYREYASEREYW